jgi:hypothetical protein
VRRAVPMDPEYWLWEYADEDGKRKEQGIG